MIKIEKKIFIFCFTCFISFYLVAEQANVTFVRGKVEVLKEDGKWYSLSVGDVINQDETISTGFSSEAKVEYNNSVMSLGALTRCTLENLSSSSEKDNISIYLKVGAVRSKVNHSKEKRVSYVVKTPVAVASVRGTDFTVTASGSITCNEGAVVVYPNTERYINNSTNIKESTETQDNEEESAKEETEKSENSFAGDYESATALTPANEIAEQAPMGSVVVGKYQTVTITNLGTTETPIINATKKAQQAKTVVTDAADQEVEVLASSTELEIASKDSVNKTENNANNANLLVDLEINN